MSYQFNIEEEKGLSLVSAHGHIRSAKDAALFMGEVIEALHLKVSRKILLDLHDLDLRAFEYFDRLEVIRELATESNTHCFRWAIIAPEDRAKPLHDFETMTRNRGYELKGFHNQDEATEWLTR
jgi:hypothetical protein